VTPELSHVVTMRYRPGVTAKLRGVYGAGDTARVFRIVTVTDPEQKHEQLVLYCEELPARAAASPTPVDPPEVP
jgi:head-tail adaptor